MRTSHPGSVTGSAAARSSPPPCPASAYASGSGSGSRGGKPPAARSSAKDSRGARCRNSAEGRRPGEDPPRLRRFRGRPTRARHPRGGDQRSAKNCCYLTPHCMGRLTPARRALFAVAPVVWSPASFAGIAPSATSTCPTASAPRRGPRARRPSPRRRCCAGASRRGRGMRRPTGPLASPPALPRT